MWSYDILVKKVATFYLGSKSLPETKGKSFRLILLTEEISKQPSIDSLMLILVVTLIKIYNFKEHAE